MAEPTFLAKLYDEFLAASPDLVNPASAVFIAWAEKWLAAHPPVGTGFADGTSALTVRFQDGSQYPLYVNTVNVSNGPSVQITGQADKVGRGGIVASAAVPITGK